MGTLVFLAIIFTALWFGGVGRYFQISRARRRLSEIPDYSVTFIYFGADRSSMAVDNISSKIAFFDKRGTINIFPLKDIVAVEVCKNGISFTKTNRGSQLIAATVGKTLFGPLGFVAGAITGSTTTSERLRALSLKIYIDDIRTPIYEVFFYQGRPIETNTKKYRQCASALDEWYARLRLAMIAPSHPPTVSSPSPLGTTPPSRLLR
jgi:hypothetical protein